MNPIGTEENAPASPSWLRIVFIGRNPRNTLIRILVLVAICFVAFYFVLLPVKIEGLSMLPTYRDGHIGLVNRLAYMSRSPQRGDIVAIRLADKQVAHPHMFFMKRVIGLPGETVAFRDGHLLINGEIIDEPYVKNYSDWNMNPLKLSADQYYVVGDNRSMPQDLHEHGPVERWRIVGKLLL